MDSVNVIMVALLAALGISANGLLSKIMVRYRVCSSGLVAWASGAGGGAVALFGIFLTGRVPTLAALPALCTLVFFNTLALWLINRAFQEGDISTVLPVMGVKIPATAVLAHFILDEKHSLGVYGAVILSAAAVGLFTGGKQQKAEGGHGKSKTVPIFYAVSAAMCYATGDQFAKLAMQHIDPFTTIGWAWVLSGVICAIFLTRPYYRQYVVSYKDIALFVLNGGLVVAAIGCLFTSFQLADSVTVPNIVFASRSFFALALGYLLNKCLRVPMEQQTARIYMLRTIATVLLFVSIAVVLFE